MAEITKRQSIGYKGHEISLFRITNLSGAYIEVTNYGASIVSIVVPDRSNKPGNIVLHYDNLEDYFADTFYLGCTVGRFANRISRAQFQLNGKTYNMDKNDGRNSNHGGFNGFNKKIFKYRVNENSITFSTKSIEEEGGFPGNIDFSVTYSFSENNELKIEYKSTSDKVTPVNFTNHSYFNPSANNESILNCELQINSDEYLEMDNEFLPTGRILSTSYPAFDFNEYRVIKDMLPLKNDNLEGYNAHFIKGINLPKNKPLASVKDNNSGRIIDMYTSMPGVQVYTGDFLSGKFNPFGGICLEAQYHPDGVNHSHFALCKLEPGKEQVDTIIYHFRVSS